MGAWPAHPDGRRGAVVATVLVLLVLVAGLALDRAGGTRSAPSSIDRGSPVVGVHLQTDAANNGVTPPPTYRAATAYDAADSEVVVFGGLDDSQSVLTTTWAFSHGNWTNLTPSLPEGPSGRWGAGVAYDPVDGYVVLFGGCVANNCGSPLADTWTFAHNRWTDLTPSLNLTPSARYLPMMTWDASLGAVLLFGGSATGSPEGGLNDSWSFVHGHWAPLNTSAPPPARADAMMAFSPALNATVLFGGLSLNGFLGDTWTFHAGTWTKVTSSGSSGPTPMRAATMVWDGADNELLEFGGYNSGTYYSASWWFDSGGWSPTGASGVAPPGVYGAEAAYDAADGYVLVFSGEASQGTLTTTWTFSGDHWTALISPPGSGLTILGLLLVFALLPLLFVVVVGVGHLSARRRWARLANGFPISPGGAVERIPTRGPGGRSTFAPFALVAVFVVLFGTILIAGGGGVIAAVVFVPILLILLPLMVLGPRQFQVLSVGITNLGVVFQMRRHEVRIPWVNLQPPINPPRGNRTYFRYFDPSAKQGAGFVGVTLEQARAILLSPLGPGFTVPTVVAAALGVPSQTRPAAPASPPPPPPPAPAYGGAYSSAPLASSPPQYSPQAASGFVTCQGCGQVSQRSQWMFCPNCGRRFP